MIAFEKKFLKFIDQYLKWIFLFIITIFAISIRYAGKDFISNDMASFLIPWFGEIQRTGGLQALDHQVGDYNLLYQTLIALFTYSPLDSVSLYKLLSCLFDFLLAFSCGYILCDLLQKDWRRDITFDITYTILLFLPTVVLNSAYWGQCDSIYVTFIIWTLYLLFKRKYRIAFILFGVALAFKLQSIFIVPFFIYCYCSRRDFSLSKFGYSIFVFWLSGIGGYLQGRNLTDCFKIYSDQSDLYHNMYLNVSSFWLLVGNNYEVLKPMAIILTIVILGIGLYVILLHKKSLETPVTFINTAIWSVWSILLFLPTMHERYTYLLDILLVMLCMLNKKYIVFAIGEILLSLLTYGHYLFGTGMVNIGYAITNLLLWIAFGYKILNEEHANR